MPVNVVGAKISAEIHQWNKVFNLGENYVVLPGFPPKTLTLDDECYPSLLRQIYDPLYVLYVKGEISLINDCSIAMVRTWQSTIYGC